ncbi:hypothetical protein [Actinosynnema sp. ALI-1.44]|nr:hypothetical protein [Actinosynnema sp. ALI-1.44]
MRVTGGKCWCAVRVHEDALRRLGLHPDQPASKIVGPSPWWPTGRR